MSNYLTTKINMLNPKTLYRNSYILNNIFLQKLTYATESKPTLKPQNARPFRKIFGWQIHSYGELEELQYSDKIRLPIIMSPKDVLVKVLTSSVNPIDVAMMRGYGANLLNTLRCSDIEFPLTLGRDFCGIVTQKGLGVQNFEVGDKVMGVTSIHKQGCHSQYTLTDSSHITKSTKNLSDIEAGSILYAGLTAWSGLFISGLLAGVPGTLSSNCDTSLSNGKKILILGGSGGVGLIAAQIAIAQNCHVVVTCSTDAVPLIEGLGITNVIDYNSNDYIEKITSYGIYDIILDCAGKGADYANQVPWNFLNYITFSSPLLRNIDSHGLASGLARNICSIIDMNIKSISAQKALVKWGYFIPATQGIEYLKNLVIEGKLKPIVQKVYSINKLDEAYKKVSEGHLHGKIMLDFQS